MTMIELGHQVKCNVCSAHAPSANKPGPARTNAVNVGFVLDPGVYADTYCSRHVPEHLK